MIDEMCFWFWDLLDERLDTGIVVYGAPEWPSYRLWIVC